MNNKLHLFTYWIIKRIYTYYVKKINNSINTILKPCFTYRLPANTYNSQTFIIFISYNTKNLEHDKIIDNLNFFKQGVCKQCLNVDKTCFILINFIVE